MEEIINFILLILTLITITMIYGIFIRTSKELKKGSIFLFLAFIVLAIKWGSLLLNPENINFTRFRIFSGIFLILSIIGLYYIRKAIKVVNGEITSNGKIKIKRGGIYKKLVDWIKNRFS